MKLCPRIFLPGMKMEGHFTDKCEASGMMVSTLQDRDCGFPSSGLEGVAAPSEGVQVSWGLVH